MDLAEALERVLRDDPARAPIDGLDAWWAGHLAAASGTPAPIARALLAGAAADRPGYAFASGLQEALAQLVGEPARRRWALCASEEGGAHPRAIAATLRVAADGWRLTGTKRWSTLASVAEELLIVARLPAPAADDAARPRLAVVRVAADRPGVAVEATPPAPFVPEIPHAIVTLTDVRVDARERLPGDGYARYLKPFRTIEDCFVHAALVAWAIQVGRRCSWPKEHIEALAGLAVGLAGLAVADPRSPAVHLALAELRRRTASTAARARSGTASTRRPASAGCETARSCASPRGPASAASRSPARRAPEAACVRRAGGAPPGFSGDARDAGGTITQPRRRRPM
ncbi:MAG: acyl-CoA dehydrogenase family protein [Nannocystaceae bacterium]